ncbi:MAG: DUF995 domain-containing protein [Cohaesibacteraceae bacterium]|nr:DUF995 domain-containing protein [Cohaesibacteraceae bacterium]MBL4875991.1 DUF995 domain-containing protein [Cohaesibacteraceae bacterium]
MKHVFRHLMLATNAVGLCSPAMSHTLSPKAKKLSSAQVKKIYSGKTANWKRTKGYFAPDGTFLSWHRKNKHYVVGKWKVNGNKTCKSGTWHAPSSGETGSMKKGDSVSRKVKALQAKFAKLK